MPLKERIAESGNIKNGQDQGEMLVRTAQLNLPKRCEEIRAVSLDCLPQDREFRLLELEPLLLPRKQGIDRAIAEMKSWDIFKRRDSIEIKLRVQHSLTCLALDQIQPVSRLTNPVQNHSHLPKLPHQNRESSELVQCRTGPRFPLQTEIR